MDKLLKKKLKDNPNLIEEGCPKGKLLFSLPFSTLAALLLLLFLSTSCGRLCLPNIDAWRRPQVMMEVNKEVLDYNPILEGYDELLEEAKFDCLESDGREPLTPEMFQPYQPSDEKFILSVGDFVAIAIFEEDETIADTVAIAPDGRLYYSLLDKGVPAAGHTIPEVRSLVENEVRKYFVNPIVTLSAKTSISENYRIMGRVSLPGVYSTVDPLRLREAIGNAGGILKEDFTGRNENTAEESLADLHNSFLIRDKKKLDIDFHDLIYNPNTNQDLFVIPGDYIFIAATPFSEVYVLGAVTTPVRLRFDKGMRLMEALASAGGWTLGFPYSADISRCMVIRGCLEAPLYVEVDLRDIYLGKARDIVLQPGDIIYVCDKTLRFGRQLVLIALNTFVQSFASAAAGYYGQFSWFNIGLGDTND